MGYRPPTMSDSVALDVDASTTSTSFTDLRSRQMVTGDGHIAVNVSVGWSALLVPGAFRVMVDGSPCCGIEAAVGEHSGAINTRVHVGAGSHTVALQWRTSTLGTLRVRPQSNPDTEHATIMVDEVR